MQGANDAEEQQRSGRQISCKEDEKQEVAREQHLLAWERVDQKSTERACDERRHGVTAEHGTNHVLGRVEGVVQIEWQQRHQQVEGEEQQEVCRAYLDKISIPQFVGFLGHSMRILAVQN